jgi:hypothetical protein
MNGMDQNLEVLSSFCPLNAIDFLILGSAGWSGRVACCTTSAKLNAVNGTIKQ